MIIFEEVYKRYIVDHAPGKWVLQGLSLAIPHKACVAVIGSAHSGKSTLLRLAAGTENPTEGKVVRNCKTASPASYSRSFQPTLSGRQNVKFICRLNGYAEDIDNRLSRVEQFAGLGKIFDKPTGTYTAPLRMRLSLALSMAFDFDIYISDGFNFAGETGFNDKDAADTALKRLTEQAGIIMTAKGAQYEATLKRYCKSAIWLHEGQAKWFDDISEGFEAYSACQPNRQKNVGSSHQAHHVSEQMQPIVAKIQHMQNALSTLSKVVSGQQVAELEKKIPWLVEIGKIVGLELVTMGQIIDLDYRVKENMLPVLQTSGTENHRIEYYDLLTQCEKLEPPR